MHRYDPPRRLLAYAIAGLAGFVDATGFLAADRYFVSFMSGNTTRLGVDLATDPSSALVPAALIAGFIAAVTSGALLADAAGARRKTVVTGVSALLLLAAGAARMADSTLAFMACLVLAMGVLNNAFRRDGEVAVGLTYMTGALVRFGQGLAGWLKGERRAGWQANALLWCSLAAGAVSGAAIAAASVETAAWSAGAIGVAIASAAALIERERR